MRCPTVRFAVLALAALLAAPSIVPAALAQRDGKTVAFSVGEDGKVAMHAVSTGIDMGKDKQVLSGLAAGQSVVLDPPAALKDGDAVVETGGEAAP